MIKKLLFTTFLCSSLTIIHAQNDQNDITTPNDSLKEKKIEYKIMPYISYNRNLKAMFGIIPMANYRINAKDSISPKSISGFAGVYTTNNSYFVGFFNRWYFKEDTWRAALFAVVGDHISQFYMEDTDVSGFYDYDTNMTMISAAVKRQLTQSFYTGLTYTYTIYDTVYEDDVQEATKTTTNALELNMLYDSRDAVYYPTKGINTTVRFITYPEWIGNDQSANKVITNFNTYFATRNNTDVIAARFSGQFGLGDIPFEQQETIGGKDIRGYSEGKYRGDGLMSIQGEYRYNFNAKMGLVGFAGIATIYGSTNENFDWDAYPGFGLGYRYNVFNDMKFNIGLDAAVGKGDWGIYFRIGESF
ncbi:BamA/TamA family outer membrane protein [Aestuariibaculum sediminum]|uniref:BamA/TamA family outer membrane protein n=1 Tax=Aestuariibaculum sediminum TaxID=2770637 RepID=A0A8J6Q2C8_9FLAO|nr:BamA/TamA family outer membrane protein [Aestuariibaculum sediminum]MBD0831730.1 BamA/TamA family outer membrane protein [Aestuariibaculum sediminum]